MNTYFFIALCNIAKYRKPNLCFLPILMLAAGSN